jgi:outer membrane lipoprotein carrier protein
MKIITTLLLVLSFNIQAKSFIPNKFSATFEQVYKSALTGKEKRSQGTIDYSYPGSIKLETQKPEKLIYVSNNKTTWYYTPPFIEGESGQVSIQQSSKNSLTKFLDLLRKGLKTNKYYSVKNKKNEYIVSFKKSAQRDLGVKTATLVFSNKSAIFSKLKKIKMVQVDKKEKTLILSKVNRSPKFSKKYFEFKIPKNTKINR